MDAQVVYFGGAPGLVAGVFQANVVCPMRQLLASENLMAGGICRGRTEG
jgi:hypothetical protein